MKSFKKASKAKQSQAAAATQDALSGREAAIKLQEDLLSLRRQLQTQETESTTRCASLTAELNEARKALNQNKDELESLRGTVIGGERNSAGVLRGRSDVALSGTAVGVGAGMGSGVGAGMGVGVVGESHQLRELALQLKATEEQLERQISSALVSQKLLFLLSLCMSWSFFCYFYCYYCDCYTHCTIHYTTLYSPFYSTLHTLT